MYYWPFGDAKDYNPESIVSGLDLSFLPGLKTYCYSLPKLVTLIKPKFPIAAAAACDLEKCCSFLLSRSRWDFNDAWNPSIGTLNNFPLIFCPDRIPNFVGGNWRFGSNWIYEGVACSLLLGFKEFLSTTLNGSDWPPLLDFESKTSKRLDRYLLYCN